MHCWSSCPLSTYHPKLAPGNGAQLVTQRRDVGIPKPRALAPKSSDQETDNASTGDAPPPLHPAPRHSKRLRPPGVWCYILANFRGLQGILGHLQAELLGSTKAIRQRIESIESRIVHSELNSLTTCTMLSMLCQGVGCPGSYGCHWKGTQ